MKYIAPKAEVLQVEVSQIILLSTLSCLVDYGEDTDGNDRLPDLP